MKGGFMFKVKVIKNNGYISNYECNLESLYWDLYTWFTKLGYKVEVYQNNKLILGR